MSFPTPPANLASGAIVNETWVDRVVAYLDYWGENRPGVVVVSTMKDDGGSQRQIFNTSWTKLLTSDSTQFTPHEIGYTTFFVFGNLARLTVPVTGRWWVWMETAVTGATSGASRCGFELNASGSVISLVSAANVSGLNTYLNGGRQHNLSTNDTLDFQVWQNSGSAAEIAPSRWGMYLLGAT